MRWLPLVGLLAGCASWIDSGPPDPPPFPPPPPPPPPPTSVPALDRIGTFNQPTFVAGPPGDSSRLMVVERQGAIRLLINDVLQTRPFLDLRGKISAAEDGPFRENGLFSVTFHPDYQTNRRFYAFFTNLNGDIRVVRYLVSANPDSADEQAADTILAVPHPIDGTTLPFANHHGGQLQFGPDGKLYVSLGDGGCCGDPLANAQDKHDLNGKILRLDVAGATGYVIPPDNPFASDTSGEPEIWAYGLRNPWRFSFDRQNGDLWVADVGDAMWEEVNHSPAASGGGTGVNYGWNAMEGTHCFNSPTCNSSGLTLPLIEYEHAGGACSVTGGYVYRGTRVAALAGQYLYGDYCAAFVRSYNAGATRNWTSQLSPGSALVSFGQDARGDVYIVSLDGAVYRIVEGVP